jgi:hypothetical protein
LIHKLTKQSDSDNHILIRRSSPFSNTKCLTSNIPAKATVLPGRESVWLLLSLPYRMQYLGEAGPGRDAPTLRFCAESGPFRTDEADHCPDIEIFIDMKILQGMLTRN